MTRKSPRKTVDTLFWQGRPRAARAYLQAAQQATLLAEPGQNANPVISQIVLAAIACGDSDEAQYGARMSSIDEARRLLDELEEFSRWAEDAL